MTARQYRESDAKPELLRGKTVAVIGYGSQGRAHALNLHDSGIKVVVGVRPEGPSAKAAKADGLATASVADAVKQADLVAILTPDMAQPGVYNESVAPNIKDGAAVLFAHGFNIHYHQIEPKKTLDVIMCAPKSPGALVRRQYQEGFGVPCLIAVQQDASGKAKEIALAYAHHIGGTKAGVLETTFAEETETDLFGEQAVLCGGATELIVAGFETLVNAGYSREAAYFECLHELKLIVDLIYEGGISKMLQYVSDTAKYGDVSRGPRVVNGAVRMEMKKILEEIRSGKFAQEWIAESKNGAPNFKRLVQQDKDHEIETVGKTLRASMSWLNNKPK